MTLAEFQQILLRLTAGVYHFEAGEDAGEKYIVWQETGGRALYGNNRCTERTRQIRVVLHTREKESFLPDRLLCELDRAGATFEEPVTEYDPETKWIRHTVMCEVPYSLTTAVEG